MNLFQRLQQQRQYYRLKKSLGVGWQWLPWRRTALKAEVVAGRGRYGVDLGMNLLFPVDRADKATHRLLLKGEGFEDLRFAIGHYLQEGELAVDLGANLGFVSLLLAARVGSRGKVYAIEPNPALHDRIKTGAWLNRFHQLELLPYACGDEEGELGFDVDFSDHSKSHLSTSGGSLKVAVRRLDSLLAERPQRIAFIKIDVEGFEGQALAGAQAILREDKPVLVFETGTHTPEQVARIGQELGKAGYRIAGVLHDWGVECMDWSAQMTERSHCNVLALPI